MNSELVVSWLVGVSWASGLLAGGYYIGATSLYDARASRAQKQIKKHPYAKKLRARPLVSVILVTRNNQDDVDDSLESITASRYKKIELLVIDNASTDKTRAAIRGFIKKDSRSRIKLVSKRHQTPDTMLFRLGLKRSTGAIVLFLKPGVDMAPHELKATVEQLNLSDMKPRLLESAPASKKTLFSLAKRSRLVLFEEPELKARLLRPDSLSGLSYSVFYGRQTAKRVVQAASGIKRPVIKGIQSLIAASWLALVAYLFFIAIAHNYALPLGLGLLGVLAYALLLIAGDAHLNLKTKLGTLVSLPGTLAILYFSTISAIAIGSFKALSRRLLTRS